MEQISKAQYRHQLEILTTCTQDRAALGSLTSKKIRNLSQHIHEKTEQVCSREADQAEQTGECSARDPERAELSGRAKLVGRGDESMTVPRRDQAEQMSQDELMCSRASSSSGKGRAEQLGCCKV